jgi:hypothetical protein
VKSGAPENGIAMAFFGIYTVSVAGNSAETASKDCAEAIWKAEALAAR